jgi:excisionase family DNA binding protein
MPNFLHFRVHEGTCSYLREAERVEEIITPSEVAALLRIHVKTVYRLAEEGLIPGKRIGRSWRFRKSSVLELISREDGLVEKVHNKKD